MNRLILSLILALSTSASAQNTNVPLGVEHVAEVSLCPDQASAQAVVTAHAQEGLQAARLVYSEKCVSATVYITPIQVVSRTKVDGQTVKVIRSLVRMRDNSQAEWFMLTFADIQGEA